MRECTLAVLGDKISTCVFFPFGQRKVKKRGRCLWLFVFSFSLEMFGYETLFFFLFSFLLKVGMFFFCFHVEERGRRMRLSNARFNEAIFE